jgi:hypothetical protein
VRAGGAKLDVRPVSGASRIRVESGGVDVRLQPGSDVRLRARAELGEVKAMKGGAIDFLCKPVKDRDLLDAIERAVTEAPGRSMTPLTKKLNPTDTGVMRFQFRGER